ENSVVALSQSRAKAADALAEVVNEELPPLKLEKAKFQAVLEPLEKGQWQADGGEKVAFEVSTNPGAPFGPLIKIASGGELSRFILALKVALADRSGARTMIFDEVDRGVGGATASAIGERLARLAESAQLMVVTHSPQVAARGADHWRIQKSDQGEVTVTTVVPLETQDRREEIARMLSGAFVTDEARAAADSLLRGAA
ncbi:MAG: DNA repair protein RecN, partial [Sphingomonadales bacterium]